VRAVEVSGYDLAPIPSASVDVVYCTVVFMHLDEWDRFNYIAEGMRVLRPGGRMLVDNFNLQSDEGWRLFEELRRLDPRQRPSHISKSSTPQELYEYFRRAGFASIEQEQSGMWAVVWGRKPMGR
jgi:ubiquinone/menaquinone biosynthesis C-methylase UbiE